MRLSDRTHSAHNIPGEDYRSKFNKSTEKIKARNREAEKQRSREAEKLTEQTKHLHTDSSEKSQDQVCSQ